jgi:hypothetical protein
MLKYKCTRQSGQALVAATFGLVALIGATGLAIDMGYLRYAKRLQQSAADSAAIAGAAELNSGLWDGAAKTDSHLNGFTDGANNVSVTVTNPTFNGKPAVQVEISSLQPTFFMRIFGLNSASLNATATAIMGANGLGNCLYILSRTAGGVTTNGAASIDAPNCGIIDNDDLTKNGSGHITAASIGVAGNLTTHGTGAVTPTPVPGIVPAADPLSFLPNAAPSGNCQSGTVANGKKKGDPGPGGGSPVDLFAGYYCTGIDVSGNKDVTFHAGTYYVNGDFNLTGTGTVTGNGVTFYIANGGQLFFSGNQTIQFSAPTNGTYAGILFFQSRANTSGATLNGSNTSRFEGALYFPNAPLTINGAGGSTAAYTIVVAKSLTLNGGTLNLPANYSSLANGSPIKNAVLVE